MKIKINPKGIVHYVSLCMDCDWQATRGTKQTPNSINVRNATLRHIKNTGHTAAITEESRTVYTPE